VLCFDRPALDVTAGWLGIRIDARMARDIAVLEAEMVRVIEGRAP
jgi:hypothetical protein